MSYSFTVVADTKAEALTQAVAEFGKIVAAQPDHVTDQALSLHVIEAYLAILFEADKDEEVRLNVSGYLTWQQNGMFTGASINVTANINRKVTEPL